MEARRVVALEVFGIVAAALVFVATFRVRPAWVDFALAGAAVALIFASAQRSRRLWDAVLVPGDTPKHRAWVASWVFTAIGLLVLVGLAAMNATGSPQTFAQRAMNWHIVIAIPLYLAWALLQQYIFQHFLLVRLLHIVPPTAAITLTALAFSSVHFPRWPVMALVVIACGVWSSIYYRTRTLPPLVASHALLGSVLHYWVFGNDLLSAWLS
jgi:membrane protease YdiL (CAAX protease family)